MLKFSNTSKPSSKFKRNKKNNVLEITCNLKTKSNYNIWLLLWDEVLLVMLQEHVDQCLLPLK